MRYGARQISLSSSIQTRVRIIVPRINRGTARRRTLLPERGAGAMRERASSADAAAPLREISRVSPRGQKHKGKTAVLDIGIRRSFYVFYLYENMHDMLVFIRFRFIIISSELIFIILDGI